MTVPVLNSYYFEDLKVGMRETILKTVMDSDVVGFAQIAGGDNTANLSSAVLGTRLPGPGAVYMSQTLNFMGPVRIGDVVVVDVEVIELVEKGRRCRLHCECSVDNQVVLEGEATVMVPGRPKPAVG